ncbi:MAG: TetR/AcrR family transcriptional regulator [Gammaproteobacteria bacterium]|nr:TetR/AcrR family transcriptional regulator [Gammaproteobacteria bacterium]
MARSRREFVTLPDGGKQPAEGEAGDRQGGKRRRLTQAERTALSDTRMFNAAMMLISEHGANRTTLKDICEQAGYSRGLANYRFGSKEVFLQELLRHFNRAWVDQLKSYTDGRTGLDAFIHAMNALEHFLSEYHRYMRGGYIIWYESIGGDNEVRRQLKRNHEAYRRDVKLWLKQGVEEGSVVASVDADNFATFYCSFVFGTIYQWLVNPDAIDLPGFFEYVRGMVRKQLAAAPDPA